MSRPEYLDVTKAVDTHNPSAQTNVVQNDDPALDRSHEHHHRHMHHDKFAEQGREDEVVYSDGTTFERSAIPHQDPQDHDLARQRHGHPLKGSTDVVDMEKSVASPERMDEADPRTHHFSNFYLKYRTFFHLFIWLFFTGYVTAEIGRLDVELTPNTSKDGGSQASSFIGMILSAQTLVG